MKQIKIKGARVNNLKNIDIEIPINKLTCINGPSGSGKTSLAFHTLFTESKRRFLNSFPTYLKFFSDRPAPVDVDSIEPVLPTFGLPQINPIVGSRSTVSDLMNLTELLQNLYGNYSIEKCPNHFLALKEYTIQDYVSDYYDVEDNTVYYILTDRDNFITYLKDSPFPSRSVNENYELNDFNSEDSYWELLRFKGKSLGKLNEKVEIYRAKNIPLYFYSEGFEVEEIQLQKNKTCPECDFEGHDKIQLSHFSPYNALGACDECNGFGATLQYDENKILIKELSVGEGGVKLLEYKRFMGLYEDLEYEMKKQKISLQKPIKDLPTNFSTLLYKGKGVWCGLDELFSFLESKKYKPSVRIFLRGIQKEEICKSCNGSRINKMSHDFFIFNKSNINYQKIWDFNINNLLDYMTTNDSLIIKNESSLRLHKKIIKILKTTVGLGLGHLDLKRKIKTVSSGEYQRLLLLKYIAYEGTGALFIFDEPSLGLSEKESQVLLNSFKNILSQGNTILLVEHSEFFHKNSDYIIEMGKGSGHLGGEVIYKGKYKKKKDYSVKLDKIKISEKNRKWFVVENANIYGKDFKGIKFPAQEIVLLKGDAGTGKSAIVVNTLVQEILAKNKKDLLNIEIGKAKKITVPKNCIDAIVVDSNLNRYTSRSSVGSLTGLVGPVRKHFLNTPFAKSMNLKDGHLSSNSDLGKCPSCEGKGVNIVEMQFLEDIILTCEDCNGKKIKPLYSELSDGEMTVYEAYSKPMENIISKIKLTPKFRRVWEFMQILNIDYLSLDRTINSLSGGERQRIYLLSKLLKGLESSLLVLENISFGLSDKELHGLCELLQNLVIENNTIIIIDKNPIFEKISTYTAKTN